MLLYKEFDQVVSECFDIHDHKTRKILLSPLTENDQNQILTSLTEKLYKNITDKIDDIDFGDIPRTKGDITALPDYRKMKECLETLEGLLVQYKQKTEPVDTINNAITNLEMRKEMFMRAYRYECELPMVVYNSIALACIASISLLTATCIEFIKTPSQDSFDIVLDQVALNKTKESLLFINLKKFNEACKRGQIDTAMETIIKSRMKNLTGSTTMIVAGVALTVILFNIIPVIRELIFFFYHMRVRVSDYFDIQGDLLRMNAHNIENSGLKSNDDRRKIIAKQLKISELFKKVANKIAVDAKESEAKATRDVADASKKNKIDDVADSIPDAIASNSSLF